MSACPEDGRSREKSSPWYAEFTRNFERQLGDRVNKRLKSREPPLPNSSGGSVFHEGDDRTAQEPPRRADRAARRVVRRPDPEGRPRGGGVPRRSLRRSPARSGGRSRPP